MTELFKIIPFAFWYRKGYKNGSKCLKTRIISLQKERTEVYLLSFLIIRRVVVKKIMISIFVLGKIVLNCSVKNLS